MSRRGTIEREVKLGGHPGFTMPALDEVVAGVQVVNRPALDLDATYFDTPDLRLVREGISLRRRTGDGDPTWTLKLPAGPSAVALQRREFDVVDDSSEIPDELASLVTGWVRTAPLGAVIDILSHRERLTLVDPSGTELAEIDDDHVSVREGGSIVARFREIEVELGEGGSEDLLRVVTSALVDAGAGSPDPMPKVNRALGPRASVPSDLSVTAPRRDASIADVLASGLRTAVAEIIVNDPVIRLDVDPSGVHSARWAVRRMRADLRSFARFVESPGIEQIRAELRWLADELGTLRRADVLLDRVSSATSTLASADSAAAQGLLERARRERIDARATALAALSSRRYRELLDSLLELADAAVLAPSGSPAAVEAIPATMLRLWKRTRTATRGLADEPTAEEIRELRRQIIRLRSAAELATPIFGAAAVDFASFAASVQHDLGLARDAMACERWIRDRVSTLEGLEPFVAGQLVAAQSVAVESALRAWLDSWRTCSNRSALGWFRA
jgi:CHAD domain-containing protein